MLKKIAILLLVLGCSFASQVEASVHADHVKTSGIAQMDAGAGPWGISDSTRTKIGKSIRR